MAKLTMDWSAALPPKRGDRLAFPKTIYVVLRVRPVRRRNPLAGVRFAIWAVRPDELEDSTLRLLKLSAARNGGELTIPCYWHPRKKKKPTFEQFMRVPPS